MKPTHEQISVGAYEIYCSRASLDGSPEQDWLQAEQQLTTSLGTGGNNISTASTGVLPNMGAHLSHHARNKHS